MYVFPVALGGGDSDVCVGSGADGGGGGGGGGLCCGDL